MMRLRRRGSGDGPNGRKRTVADVLYVRKRSSTLALKVTKRYAFNVTPVRLSG